jgi:uncharacterized protein YjbJ (UPF0337 family)
MDKDKVKGAINEAVGRAKRQAGEWTGNTDVQISGAAQQVKGSVQKAWGNLKDAAREADNQVHRDAEKARLDEAAAERRGERRTK